MTYTTEYETKDGKTVRKDKDAGEKKTPAETTRTTGTASGNKKE
jgi:hypothetical protein